MLVGVIRGAERTVGVAVAESKKRSSPGALDVMFVLNSRTRYFCGGTGATDGIVGATIEKERDEETSRGALP